MKYIYFISLLVAGFVKCADVPYQRFENESINGDSDENTPLLVHSSSENLSLSLDVIFPVTGECRRIMYVLNLAAEEPYWKMPYYDLRAQMTEKELPWPVLVRCTWSPTQVLPVVREVAENVFGQSDQPKVDCYDLYQTLCAMKNENRLLELKNKDEVRGTLNAIYRERIGLLDTGGFLPVIFNQNGELLANEELADDDTALAALLRYAVYNDAVARNKIKDLWGLPDLEKPADTKDS